MNQRRSCLSKYFGASVTCDDVAHLHNGEFYYLISDKDGWKLSIILAAKFMNKQGNVKFD